MRTEGPRLGQTTREGEEGMIGAEPGSAGEPARAREGTSRNRPINRTAPLPDFLICARGLPS